MNKFVSKNIPLISFILIPLIFWWHPNWLGLLGSQPYWPILWLLPWSMIHGSINGVIFGLFLGLTLDAITLNDSFTQIPGLILCGLWFGRISIHSNDLVGHLRYGLICSIATLLCGALYLFQILVKNIPENNFIFLYPGIKNILVQIFLTGFFAPLICSKLLRLFKSSKEKNILFNFIKK